MSRVLPLPRGDCEGRLKWLAVRRRGGDVW